MKLTSIEQLVEPKSRCSPQTIRKVDAEPLALHIYHILQMNSSIQDQKCSPEEIDNAMRPQLTDFDCMVTQLDINLSRKVFFSVVIRCCKLMIDEYELMSSS